MKKLVLTSTLTFIIFFTNAQTFWDQTQLDTYNFDNSWGEIYIKFYDSIVYKPITDLTPLKKLRSFGKLIIINTQLTKIDFDIDLDIYAGNMQIKNNKKLKWISGLKNIQDISVIDIDSNENLESVIFSLDSIRIFKHIFGNIC